MSDTTMMLMVIIAGLIAFIVMRQQQKKSSPPAVAAPPPPPPAPSKKEDKKPEPPHHLTPKDAGGICEPSTGALKARDDADAASQGPNWKHIGAIAGTTAAGIATVASAGTLGVVAAGAGAAATGAGVWGSLVTDDSKDAVHHIEHKLTACKQARDQSVCKSIGACTWTVI